MGEITSNYHTHTPRCKHAVGSEKEYIENAITLGIKNLGFADHAPWYYQDGHISSCRMDEAQLHDYATTLKQLKKDFKDQITIHIGLEAEYVSEKIDWLVRRCQQEDIEYLILGNHFYPVDQPGKMQYNYFSNCDEDGIKCYLESVEAAFKSGYYAYLAHPELFLTSYPCVDEVVIDAFERICDLSLIYDMPLEYNLSGYSTNLREGREIYPHDQFWRIAGKKGCKAIVGFDAHDPNFLFLMQEVYIKAEKQLAIYGCQVIHEIKHTLKK